MDQGSLQGPSAAAAVISPIPAETGQRYSKHSPLTVLLRPQVQIISLARLWLVLAGSSELRSERRRTEGNGPPLATTQHCPSASYFTTAFGREPSRVSTRRVGVLRRESCRFFRATVVLLQHFKNFERKPHCRTNCLVCYPEHSARREACHEHRWFDID